MRAQVRSDSEETKSSEMKSTTWVIDYEGVTRLLETWRVHWYSNYGVPVNAREALRGRGRHWPRRNSRYGITLLFLNYYEPKHRDKKYPETLFPLPLGEITESTKVADLKWELRDVIRFLRRQFGRKMMSHRHKNCDRRIKLNMKKDKKWLRKQREKLRRLRVNLDVLKMAAAGRKDQAKELMDEENIRRLLWS